MKKNKFLKLLACLIIMTLIFGSELSKVGTTHAVHADEETTEDGIISFETAKGISSEQVFTFERSGFTGQLKVWLAILEVDPSIGIKKAALYGQFGFPFNSSEVGVEDGQEGNKLFLPKEDSYVTINGGLRSYLVWSKMDLAGKYDKQLFLNDGYLYIRKNEKNIKLMIAGQEFTVKVAQKSEVLNTSYLEQAITEHWNTYQSIKTSGMKLTEESEKAYVEKNEEARALIEKAKTNSNEVSQQEIDYMRESLNIIFAELKPQPFERKALSEAVNKAKEIIKNNGKSGELYTKTTFDSLLDATLYGENLLNTEDLKTVKPPKHGEPLPTHKDFDNAVININKAINGLELEKDNFKKLDYTELDKVYYEAIQHRPTKGFGYEDGSRKVFYDTLEKYKYIRNNQYLTNDDIAHYTKEIKDALTQLKEIKLDENEKVELSIKFIKHPINSISDLSKDYFRDENNEIITIKKEIVKNSEVYIKVSDTNVIKHFEGYEADTFYYNFDDTTLKFVKYFEMPVKEDSFIVFKASSKNINNKASLDIGYKKLEQKPEPKPETKPETKSEPKSEPKQEPKPETKPEPKSEPKQEPKSEPKPELKPEPKPELNADKVDTKESNNQEILPKTGVGANSISFVIIVGLSLSVLMFLNSRKNKNI